MLTSNPRQTLLAVNSTEWLNLCARGSIRMSKRRPVTVSDPVTHRGMEKVFVTAPFTKMESSIDLFILVISNQWAKSTPRHRAFPSEVMTLSLSDVVSHHPVARDHLEYYRNIASQCGVHLDNAIFEESWLHWVTNETIQASLDSAESLQAALQLDASYRAKRSDKYTWGDIARLVLRPREPVKAKAALAESLLRNISTITDAVSGTRDTEQFYLACAIEWVDIRLGKDPTKTKAIREVVLAALDHARERPIREPSDETRAALDLLQVTFPKAFNDEITPVTVAHIVRLMAETRSKKLLPATVFAIFRSLDEGAPSAALINMVLATALGPELSLNLIRASIQANPMHITWDVPN
jgi:hypothetical protein